MAASSQDIRAGGAAIELSVNDAGLRAGLARAQQQLSGFLSSAQTLASAIGFGGLTSQVTGLVQEFASAGREMYQLSQRTGISVTELDELKKVAGESGIGFDSVSAGVRRLSRFLGDLRTSGRDSNETLDALNLTMTDLEGMSFIDQMSMIANRISNIGDASQRTSLTMALMGRQGDELIPMFRDIDAARGRAREGGLMNPEDAARAFDLSIAFDKLSRASSGVYKAIGSALAPAFKPVIDLLTAGQKAIKDWVKENETLVQTIGWTVSGLGVVAAGIASFAAAGMVARTMVTGLVSGFGGLVSTVTSILPALNGMASVLTGGLMAGLRGIAGVGVGAIRALLNPVRSIVSAFGMLKVAAMAAWAVVTSPLAIVAGLGAIAYVAFDLGSTFREVGALIGETWGGVVDAFKSGDLALAGRIGLAGLKIAWVEFKNWFMNVWEDLPGAVGRVWDRLMNFFGASIEWLKGRWQAFLDWLTGSGSGASQAQPEMQRSPAEQRRDEIAAARQELADLLAQARQQREEADNALRDRLDNTGENIAATTSGGTRGVFNASAAFGLVGGRNPVVEAVQAQTSSQREQLRRIEENTREMGARFW